MTGDGGTVKLIAPSKPQDFDAVRALCWDYRAALIDLGPKEAKIVETIYTEPGYRTALGRLEIDHAAPGGALRLALLDGKPVGCGMTRTIAPKVSELKRLYVAPAARGHGTGRSICESLIAQARADRFQVLRLDTSLSLKAAQALYTSLGFIERGPYSTIPEIAEGHLLFYELWLD